MNRVFIGWDQGEVEAYKVACKSLRATAKEPVQIIPVGMDLIDMYDRETHMVCADGQLHDAISDARMTTGHAIARFFIHQLTERKGWVLFTDGDVLFRKDVGELFALADDRYAVMVVQHNYRPNQQYKKGYMQQSPYPKKNWSSVMLCNLSHSAWDALSIDVLNTTTGRALHGFDWLQAVEVGALPDKWNWLVNHSISKDPGIVHFTEGIPSIPGHETDAFADEWLKYAFSFYHCDLMER